MRYLVPAVLFAAAAFVWHYNGTHTDAYMLFPFLDLVPALKGDLEAQAEWSWRILAGIGALTLIGTIVGDLRRRARDRPVERE